MKPSFAFICVCLSVAALSSSTSASLASGYRILNGGFKDLIDGLQNSRSRNLLQTSSTTLLNLTPTESEMAYCFPYYYVYGFTGNAYTQCLNIVQGQVTGTGLINEDCYTPLFPLYTTFTSTQFSSSIADYNRCLFNSGYSLTSSAQSRIQASTVPAITSRVGPGTQAFADYQSSISDTTISDASTATYSPIPTTSSYSSSYSDTPVTVDTLSGISSVLSNGNVPGLVVPDWGKKL